MKWDREQWFRPRLELYECEGHGRYWEAYEGHDGSGYVGTFDTPEAVCAEFGGRIALVYGYAAYEAACDVVIRQDPEGFDLSEVKPRPFLVRVRTVAEVAVIQEREDRLARIGAVYPEAAEEARRAGL